jgi:acyl carrier protein
MKNVEQTIKDYVRSEFMVGKQGVALRDDENLIDAGIVDSLAIFVLIAFMEKEFGLKLQAEDVVLENFTTLNAINNLVRAKQMNGSPEPESASVVCEAKPGGACQKGASHLA